MRKLLKIFGKKQPVFENELPTGDEYYLRGETLLMLKEHGFTIKVSDQARNPKGLVCEPFYYAGIAEYLPLIGSDIEIPDDYLVETIGETMNRVLMSQSKFSKKTLRWAVFMYQKDNKPVYTIDATKLPLSGGVFTGMIFIADKDLIVENFADFENNIFGEEFLREQWNQPNVPRNSAKEVAATIIANTTEVVSGKYCTVTLKKQGGYVAHFDFVEKYEWSINQSIRNLINKSLADPEDWFLGSFPPNYLPSHQPK